MLTVSEERAVARRLRVPVERVRVAKRVRTETVSVQVQVRREELVVTREPVAPEEGEQLAVLATGDEQADQVVLLLSEEVPVVGVEVRPLERVVVTTRPVEGRQRVEVDLAREVVDVEGASETGPGDQRTG